MKVEVIATRGALDNLDKLANPAVKVDVGFVQGGLTEGRDLPHLVSLGSVYPQPLMVYCRSAEPIEMLSQLKGKRLAVGPEGSGARVLALKLLKANEIDGPPTVLLDLAGDEAVKQLLAGTIDAAFLMGDSATPPVMKTLRGVPEIQLASFRQADGYLRKFRFLSKLTLPEGAMDLAKNYPPRTLSLIGPTVELVARDDLHPALSDLLIRAAREIHGSPGLYRNAGRVSGAAGARLPDQRRRRALLQVRRAVPLQAAAVLAGEPGRSAAGRAAAAAGRDRAGDAAGAGDLPLADPVAHLPLVRRADGDRARDARRSLARGERGAPRAAGRHRGPVNELKMPPPSPTSSTCCAITSNSSVTGIAQRCGSEQSAAKQGYGRRDTRLVR